MDMVMFIILLVFLGLEWAYNQTKRTAKNSEELMYKYQLLGHHRRFKSGQYAHIRIQDKL